MNKFELTSAYQPTGDQPEAIAQLTEGVLQGLPAQTLLGVTGSGKTFTIANVIANVNKPTLVLSHNKTLAAQLYSEFKNFFPNNAVEYYVSYYDYYQPEAYLPSSDTFCKSMVKPPTMSSIVLLGLLIVAPLYKDSESVADCTFLILNKDFCKAE